MKFPSAVNPSAAGRAQLQPVPLRLTTMQYTARTNDNIATVPRRILSVFVFISYYIYRDSSCTSDRFRKGKDHFARLLERPYRSPLVESDPGEAEDSAFRTFQRLRGMSIP